MFIKFNLKIQTLIIGAADSLITKLFNMLSINNNILLLTNIITTIILITTNADDVEITISLIILKKK